MGIEALTVDTEGQTVIPATEDEWREWVSASSTRNYAIRDPLLDWLDIYGEKNGFRRDDDDPGYDPRTDFTEFIFSQGHAFERAVVDYLRTLTTVEQVGGGDAADSRDLGKAEETFAAMQRGEPDHLPGRGQGRGDAHVRLAGHAGAQRHPGGAVPEAGVEDDAGASAPDLDSDQWHYVVVDVKFTTLRLLVSGGIQSGGSTRAYKAQLYIYSRALGRLQGYTPPVSYILGRSWRGPVDGKTVRGSTCMERLGRVPQDSTVARGATLAGMTDEAVEWVRRVRVEGMHWSVTPEPSVPQLKPNMRNTSDSPWSSAKREIEAILAGNPWVEGMDSISEQAPRGQMGFWPEGEQAPETDFSAVSPAKVTAGGDAWRDPGLAFYVDFETVSDLNDDFSLIPNAVGANMIFLIGCGHMEGRRWHYRSFLARELSVEAEGEVIDGWIAHMREVRERLGRKDVEPLVFHWSPAETTLFQAAYDSAVTRHPGREWPPVRWFDFLGMVMRKEPVRIEGAKGLGLKAVARAMKRQRLIDSTWDDASNLDGLGAMVGAFWAANEARRLGVTLDEVDLVREIVRYNEIDCKVMMEIIAHLRRFH